MTNLNDFSAILEVFDSTMAVDDDETSLEEMKQRGFAFFHEILIIRSINDFCEFLYAVKLRSSKICSILIKMKNHFQLTNQLRIISDNYFEFILAKNIIQTHL